MVAKKKDSEMESALKDIKKLVNNVSTVVKRDFGRIKLRYKEGTVVKKARIDIAKGLNDVAKALKIKADKVKGKN